MPGIDKKIVVLLIIAAVIILGIMFLRGKSPGPSQSFVKFQVATSAPADQLVYIILPGGVMFSGTTNANGIAMVEMPSYGFDSNQVFKVRVHFPEPQQPKLCDILPPSGGWSMSVNQVSCK